MRVESLQELSTIYTQSKQQYRESQLIAIS